MKWFSIRYSSVSSVWPGLKYSKLNLNSFPNKPLFLRVCGTNLLKTLWKKEKLLVTSNCSSSHSVFNLFWEISTIFFKFKNVVYELFQFENIYNLFFGKGLKPIVKYLFIGQSRSQIRLHVLSSLILIYTVHKRSLSHAWQLQGYIVEIFTLKLFNYFKLDWNKNILNR